MATQVTVAVGANGEVTRARSLRDGARADRLETEATRKEASKVTADNADNFTGRDNKKQKREPVTEPAAHARKKKTEGQFIGLSIRFEHFPLQDPWVEATDYPYMTIFVRGITTEGKIKEPQKIELTRNIHTETFYLDPPSDYIRDLYMDPHYRPGDGPWGLDIYPQNQYFGEFNFSNQPYTELKRNKYPISPGGTTEDGKYFASARYNWWEFREPSISVMGVFDGKTSYPVYWVCEDPPQRHGEPLFEGYPDKFDNNNTRQNGRTQLDAEISGYIDFHKDPVHELFILPFTGSKCFLLIVFTDYMIQTATGVSQVCGAQSAPAFTYNNIFIDGESQKLYTNNVLYRQENPIYKFPEGFTFHTDSVGPWLGSGPQIKVTEAGANKIQTIKLYSIEDGVMTAVERVPEQLRTTIGNLSANFKDWVLDPLEKFENYIPSTTLETCIHDPRFVQDFRLQVQVSDGPDTDSFSGVRPDAELMRKASVRNHIGASRKYLDDQAMARSIAKGFGIGRLSTGNHFESPYVQYNNNSNSFTDDYYFTPIVYEYLKGAASPSVLYSSAKPLGVVPSRFVDYDGNDKIRFSTQQPVTVTAKHSGPYEPWQEAPSLKNSTHRCWNWDKPGHCWDELRALGFGPDLIGERPKDE